MPTKAPKFTGCRIFQIASYFGMGNAGAASKAVAALLRQSPGFKVADALKSGGFPGNAATNKRFTKQLTEAGLPTGKSTPPIK